jgi:hypothetical protein
LHHRIRAVAAAAGVLLPTGADLAKQDFLTIPTGEVLVPTLSFSFGSVVTPCERSG